MVDDDVELCDMIVTYLNEDGFNASAVHNGPAALELLRTERFDALVLDLMMPGMNGHEILRRLRSGEFAMTPIPVLMLTARGDDVDRIIGLESGADDYLPKPCNLRELAARLRAILRRSMQSPAARQGGKGTVEVGDIRLDAARREASLGGKPLPLTGAEFAILQKLMEHVGEAVSKDVLTKSALGREYLPYDRSIDVHVANLRKKLQSDDAADTPIKTIRGLGYQLIDLREPA
ncbi:MAG TPA: response regulator transcription factor [Woeseiaceae bacterium]|nr:response regulator transcription factor [Woeseiaceae bacterium]